MKVDSEGHCFIDGKECVAVGFGTYRLKGDVCSQAVTDAIRSGYTLIDTATYYDNFEAIGMSLKQFERQKVYLISKVWPDAQEGGNL